MDVNEKNDNQLRMHGHNTQSMYISQRKDVHKFIEKLESTMQ